MKNNGSTETKRAAKTTKERAKDLRHRDVSLTEQTKIGGGLAPVIRQVVADLTTGGAIPVMTDGKPASPAAYPSSAAATKA
jgi:hypothetical protein